MKNKRTYGGYEKKRSCCLFLFSDINHSCLQVNMIIKYYPNTSEQDTTTSILFALFHENNDWVEFVFDCFTLEQFYILS